jgi:N-acetylneuraminic acid mutarotase
MPTARIEMSGVALGQKIYIMGGVADKTTDLVEAYDTLKDEWSTVAPLPEKLDHLAVAAYKNKIYVIGGFNADSKPTNRLFIYDPLKNEWMEGTKMPTARGALTAEFINGILYAVGGDVNAAHLNGKYNPSGQTAINEAYNPLTNSWTEKESMPTARHHHVSAVVDGKLYVIGGRFGLETSDHKFNNTNANEMYDPNKNTWISRQPMLTNRSGAAAASVNGSIYVLGGETNNYPKEDQHTYNSNERYNPAMDKWTSELPMSTPRHGLSAVAIDNKIYVIGGGKRSGSTTGDLNEIFHITYSRNSCK